LEREIQCMWTQKPLHGQFPSQIKAMTTTKCAYKWLCFSYLKLETEVMITAVLDQTIRIELYNVNVFHCYNDSIFPMCHVFDETICHAFSTCSVLVSSKYLERNNPTAFLIHKYVCEYQPVTSYGCINHNHVVWYSILTQN